MGDLSGCLALCLLLETLEGLMASKSIDINEQVVILFHMIAHNVN